MNVHASRSSPVGCIEQIKVYGERNTGTHFIDDLLAQNFSTELLPGAAEMMRPGRREIIAERERFLERLPDQNKQLYRHVVADRFNETANRKYMPKTFGWKHMSPPLEFLLSNPAARKTLFIVIVKHPVFWAISFHKRPYHSYFPIRKIEFGEFIRHLFITSGRDNVDAPMYESIIDLYAAKVDGYRALAEAGFFVELVRYEDLIANVSAFFDHLEEIYGLTRKSGEEIVREKNMKKGDEETLTDFRTKYRLDKVAEALSAEDYQFIMSRFGAERLAWLGYPPA